jgi:hypothetical protein
LEEGWSWVVDKREGLYKMVWSACSCREDENIFLYPRRKKNPYPQIVSQRVDKFRVLLYRNLFNLAPTGMEKCWIAEYCISF